MPGARIPNDWDGVSWQCYSIDWPDSDLWRALLLGQVTALKFGRYWDEQSGTIIDAQETGLEIMNRNLGLEEVLLSCNDTAISILKDLVVATATSSNSDACCVGGSKTSSTSGTEGGAPPDGWVDPPDPHPSAAYDIRKCKVANLIVDQISGFVQKLIDAGVDALITTLGQAGVPLLAVIIGGLLGELATPFPVIDALAGAVIGFIAGIALALLTETIDLAQMKLDIDNNRAAFVCALYEATDATGSRTAFLDEAANVGMGTGNQAVLAAMLAIDYLNALFFNSEQYEGSFESALATYTSPTACACSCSPAPVATLGTITAQNVGDIIVDSEFNGQAQFVDVSWFGSVDCEVNYDFAEMISGTLTCDPTWCPTLIWYYPGGVIPPSGVQVTTLAASYPNCIHRIQIHSQTAFTIKLYWSGMCP